MTTKKRNRLWAWQISCKVISAAWNFRLLFIKDFILIRADFITLSDVEESRFCLNILQWQFWVSRDGYIRTKTNICQNSSCSCVHCYCQNRMCKNCKHSFTEFTVGIQYIETHNLKSTKQVKNSNEIISLLRITFSS